MATTEKLKHLRISSADILTLYINQFRFVWMQSIAGCSIHFVVNIQVYFRIFSRICVSWCIYKRVHYKKLTEQNCLKFENMIFWTYLSVCVWSRVIDVQKFSWNADILLRNHGVSHNNKRPRIQWHPMTDWFLLCFVFGACGWYLTRLHLSQIKIVNFWKYYMCVLDMPDHISAAGPTKKTGSKVMGD